MTSADPLVLRLGRMIAAPRARVWAALTDPAELAAWWGPHGFTSPRVELDLRVGGGYRIAMQPPDGELFRLLGTFRGVEPAARLAYTFTWDPPDRDDRETVVTLVLEERGDEAGLRLTQGEFATPERLALHEPGWTESLDRLEAFLRG